MAAKLLMTQDQVTADREMWQAWRRTGVTASEISAVLGICPPEHGSPLVLFIAKQVGEIPQDTDEMTRGRHFEPYVLERFAHAHPDLEVLPGGLYVNTDRPWQMATHDALAVDPATVGIDREVIAGNGWRPDALALPVQAKTSINSEGWGEPGSPDVPVHYRAQTLYEMDVRGASTGFVPVLFMTDWKFATYVIEMDEDSRADVEVMRAEAEAFMRRLEDDDPPPVDWTPATTRALKSLHTDAPEGEVRINAELAKRYRAARRANTRSERRLALAVNEILATAGGARTITAHTGGRDVKVATRTKFPRGFIDAAVLREEHFDIAKVVTRHTNVTALYLGKWVKE